MMKILNDRLLEYCYLQKRKQVNLAFFFVILYNLIDFN